MRIGHEIQLLIKLFTIFIAAANAYEVKRNHPQSTKSRTNCWNCFISVLRGICLKYSTARCKSFYLTKWNLISFGLWYDTMYTAPVHHNGIRLIENKRRNKSAGLVCATVRIIKIVVIVGVCVCWSAYCWGWKIRIFWVFFYRRVYHSKCAYKFKRRVTLRRRRFHSISSNTSSD